MRLYWRTAALAAALLMVVRPPAFAALFQEKTPEQKLRADVANQVSGYTKCLATALLACEQSGALPAAECQLATAVASAPADPKGKFAAAIAKCDAKLDYDRKGPKGNTSVQNYELIGCPSGSSPSPGSRLADMDELESIARKAKPAIDQVATVLPTVSGCTDTKSCVAAAKLVLGYAAAFGKCETTCENDYKNKKGNGGTDDSFVRCGFTGDPKAVGCIAKAKAKFLDKAASWPAAAAVVAAVDSIIDQQSDALFDVPPNCF